MHSPTIKHRGAFVATLLTGTFSMSISQSSLSTAYPTFMKAFGLGADTVAWLTTGFMLVMTLMIPVSPWLLHNVTFQRLFQAIELIFAIGTGLCIWAPSFTVLMIGRLLEAIAVGIIFPSFQTVLLTITPHSERGRVMGTAGLVMGSALAVGPIISGVLLTWFPWQALFLFFLVVSLLVLAVSTVTIASVMPLQPTQLDCVLPFIRKFSNSTLCLGCFVEKRLNCWRGWFVDFRRSGSWYFRCSAIESPTTNVANASFATGMFTKAVFLTGISYVGLIVTTILMPLYFQTLLGLSPLISGLSLVPAAVLLSILNPISGRLLDRFGPRVVAMIGMLLITGGFGLLAVFAHHLPLIGAIMLAMATEAGNAFVMMPSVTAGANALPNELVADGTAVTTTARQLFGSAGVMFATVLLDGMQTTLRSHAGGFAVTFAVFAGVGLIGLLLALTLPKEVAKKAV